jgi:hypothetical protein
MWLVFGVGKRSGASGGRAVSPKPPRAGFAVEVVRAAGRGDGRLGEPSLPFGVRNSHLVAEVGGGSLLDFGDGAAAGCVVFDLGVGEFADGEVFRLGWGPVSRWLA